MEKTCSKCGATGCAPDVFYAKGSVCKSCVREKQRAYLEGLKASGAYQEYLHKHQAARNQLKELRRRERGCKTRASIEEAAEKYRAEKEKAREERLQAKQDFLITFIGPPKPSRALIGEAAYERWKYHSNDRHREYHKNKRRRIVEKVTFAYAREQLRIKNPSKELIEAKRFYLLIKRGLRNEEHNRAAK